METWYHAWSLNSIQEFINYQLDNDKRRVGDEPREQQVVHLLGVGLLVIVNQLMDRIGELWMIYCLNGWKHVISYDDPSTLGWAINYNQVPTLVGGWLTTCHPHIYDYLDHFAPKMVGVWIRHAYLNGQWLETSKDAMKWIWLILKSHKPKGSGLYEAQSTSWQCQIGYIPKSGGVLCLVHEIEAIIILIVQLNGRIETP
jgi:hypothetical protein